MTEHKFTDDEVIKALECCVEGTSEACRKCVFGLTPPYPVCKTVVEKYALALINRQKAEIERLNGCVKTEEEVRTIAKAVIDAGVAIAKAEAIKEFAERLKKEMANCARYYMESTYYLIGYPFIDRLVKEMTEGGEPRKDEGKNG